LYHDIPDLKTASARANARALKDGMHFSGAYGPYLGLYKAAKLKPILDAMYGDKGKVGQYTTGQVLTVLWMDYNEQAHNDWTQREYGKMMEAKHGK
jgi:hypothetical protein